MLRKAAPWFGAFTAAVIAVGFVAAQSKPMPPGMPPGQPGTPPTMRPLWVPMPSVHQSVACGVTMLPYSTEYRPSTGDTVYAARFKVSGSGLITLTVNADNGFSYQRIAAPCDPCELSVTHDYYPRVQIAVDAAADACPSDGLLLEELNLFVGP